VVLITSNGRRTAVWVPVMRCLGVLLALVLAALGAVRGTWAAAWFVAAAAGLALAAGATWRRAVRAGEQIVVSAPLRRRRTVRVRRVSIRLHRSGYGDASTLTIGPGTDDVAVPVAVFTPTSRGQVTRTARRLAAALALDFDEQAWDPWLDGRTLRAPRRRAAPGRR
jgi:hypothetical protein